MKGWTYSTFRSLRVRNYRLWASGAIVSNIGSWIQRIAQDWLVLTELTDHSASAVGILTALQFGPQLALLPLTGLAADRFDKRKLLMVTQALAGLLAIGLGTMAVLGIAELWHVYGFGVAFGCVMAFDAPARHSFVNELVGREDLANAVALNSINFNGARMIGPAIAGFAIATIGTGWAFMINGASYLAVLLSLTLLHKSDLFTLERAGHEDNGILDGFRYVWGRPDLRAISVMLFMVGAFGMNFAVWISAMAVKVFEVDADGYGMLSALMAVGTVVGAVLSAARQEPQFRHLLVGVAGFTLATLCAAIAPGFWTFGIALAFLGVTMMTFMNTSNALTQLTTKGTLRGRVMAIRMAIAMGGTAIGAPILGWVADNFGVRWSIAMGVVAGLVAVLVGFQYYLTRTEPQPRESF